MVRHLVSIMDMKNCLEEIIDFAIDIKTNPSKYKDSMDSCSLGMIFEKSSTRTRVSFEVAMTQLGGHALFLSPKDLQIGRGETIADTARVLSRYLDCIMYRAFDYKNVEELALHSEIPVINGLDNREHPCQIVADLMTVKERFTNLKGLKMVYVGDGNNVCHSLLLGGAMQGMNVVANCPKNYHPWKEIVDKATMLAEETGGSVKIIEDPLEACIDADVIYTDVWVSMGDEKEEEEREAAFMKYQVNEKLVEVASNDCIVLHCLPAHRGMEITDEVIDGEHSAAWDQAENRMHAQKAIILDLYKNE